MFQKLTYANIIPLRYEDAAPLLEIIFYIREKLVTICHVSVLECLIELVACLAHVEVGQQPKYTYQNFAYIRNLQLIPYQTLVTICEFRSNLSCLA